MVASFNQVLNMDRSGMLSNLLDLDTRSNNLANVNTTGYKYRRTNFQELLAGLQLGGVQTRSTQLLMQQGSLRETSNSLDLAIQGEGFFAVKLPDGRTAYTRDGQFSRDASGRIVNVSGYPLVWQGQLPAGDVQIHVNPDGSVAALQNGIWNIVGNIPITRFPNASGLIGYGQNLFLETPVSGAAVTGKPGTAGNGQIYGSALESSNVNLALEMTEMVSLQRSFQMSLTSFQNTDGMLSQAIHMRR
jgi:flagellar basal-body rod protein FlgG